MSIQVVIGRYKAQFMFNEIYNRDRTREAQAHLPEQHRTQIKELIAIPNLHAHPLHVQMLIDNYRGAGELLHEDLQIIITTECMAVIDYAIPAELYVAHRTYAEPLYMNERFMLSHKAGIQHNSEILQASGIWQAEM